MSSKSSGKKKKKTAKSKQTLASSLPIIGYLRQVQSELYKVTWPNRKKVIQLSGVVIAVSVVIGAYLGALDYLFAALMKYLFELTN